MQKRFAENECKKKHDLWKSPTCARNLPLCCLPRYICSDSLYIHLVEICGQLLKNGNKVRRCKKILDFHPAMSNIKVLRYLEEYEKDFCLFDNCPYVPAFNADTGNGTTIFTRKLYFLPNIFSRIRFTSFALAFPNFEPTVLLFVKIKPIYYFTYQKVAALLSVTKTFSNISPIQLWKIYHIFLIFGFSSTFLSECTKS